VKDTSKNNWRGVIRKLKSSRKRRTHLEEKLSKTPARLVNVRKPIEDELYQLNIDISVLELKESRLRPKDVKKNE